MNKMQKTQDKYGPGIWFSLHLQAAQAKTNMLKESFIQNTKVLGEHFPCENCKHHFAAYLKEHPIETYINKGEKGLFLWTWEFHDSVNKRLHKPSLSFDDAWKQFTASSAICTDECGDEAVAVVPNNKHYTIRSYHSLIPGQ